MSAAIEAIRRNIIFLLDNLKFENLSTNFPVEYNSAFSRIHKELLNLICICFVPDQLRQIRKEIEQHQLALAGMNLSSLTNKESITKVAKTNLAEVASNICSYCTSIMKVGQFNTQFLIFSPKIESHQLHPCRYLKKINSFFFLH